MRILFTATTLLLLTLAMSGCPATGPGGGDGGDNANNNGGNGNDNGSDGGGDFVTMTVSQRSLFGSAEFMTVYVCIGDQPYTRETAQYNAGCSQLQSDVDPIVRDYNVPVGSDVTLVAIEYTSSSTGGGSAAGKSNAAIYFAGWEGDDGEVISEGVQHWVADRDLSVGVIWNIMGLVTWGKVNDNRPELGGGCFDFQIVGAPWLRQGSTEVLEQTQNCMSFGVNGEIVLFGQLKPGTVVTLTANDGNNTGLEWVGWLPGACGAARACTIEMTEQDVSVVAHWRTP